MPDLIELSFHFGNNVLVIINNFMIADGATQIATLTLLSLLLILLYKPRGN